jgi:hypothetical protein
MPEPFRRQLIPRIRRNPEAAGQCFNPEVSPTGGVFMTALSTHKSEDFGTSSVRAASANQALQLALPFSRPLVNPSGPFAIPKIPPRPAAWPAQDRCVEKGCVFPAEDVEGRCLQHQRQRREPLLYSSQQPSLALLDRSRFGPLRLEYVEEPKLSRAHDRRRLAAERERFLAEQH